MRAPAICLLALISLACTPSGATTDPQQPSPANPTIAPEDPGAKGPRTIELHPIAVREGSTQLAEAGGHAYLLIDGEPIPLEPGVAPIRDPKLGRGIAPREAMFGPMFAVVDFTGRIDQNQGYLVVREDFERAGSDYDVYELGPEGWQVRAETKHGALTEMFHALVTTADGAVLGVRGWELSANDIDVEYTDDSVLSQAFWERINEDQDTAPSGFSLLSGSTAVMPTLPAGWTASDAISTSNGQIIALARQIDLPDLASSRRLLEWAPGQATATIIELPELPDTSHVGTELRLWPAGERAIVAGVVRTGEGGKSPVSYLAIGGGGSWSRVPVELPDLADEWQAHISSAALADNDELWITTGSWPAASATPQTTLWRQSGGQWQAVELPALDQLTAAADANERWVYDALQEMWVVVMAGQPEQPLYPAATGVVFAEGELWVTAELGPAYPGSTELYSDDRRTALFASRPVDEPGWLPSFDRIHLERVDQAVAQTTPELGGPGCERFTIVLLDDPDASAIEPIATKLGAGEPPNLDGAAAHELYVGALLDAPERSQLVYSAYANSPRDAKALVELVGKRSGVSARADCRPRTLVRMLASM